ncbi:uncharacterized protein PHALS_00555 [Plasmopara halstedii]|uniref:Uncharacterized protein n=1 Tax=Plasmopara halstedii TaxID=4781 RepID=A0A0P1A7X6_PLAHL|nr:uncharacterized protein PHALS_00555 [Plasmopara halstedii]CEG36236.1 hypothetical protein PHALS_00555 [Plasmopara halstedii]|eukprot:XP_024572605.1 hypothetical protein PHALS_00555 [Plasmopara halstedii]
MAEHLAISASLIHEETFPVLLKNGTNALISDPTVELAVLLPTLIISPKNYQNTVKISTANLFLTISSYEVNIRPQLLLRGDKQKR